MLNPIIQEVVRAEILKFLDNWFPKLKTLTREVNVFNLGKQLRDVEIKHLKSTSLRT